MKDTLDILDVVAITVDLPERGLYRGQVGTVVEILAPRRLRGGVFRRRGAHLRFYLARSRSATDASLRANQSRLAPSLDFSPACLRVGTVLWQ
jgi:hypothetical protein